MSLLLAALFACVGPELPPGVEPFEEPPMTEDTDATTPDPLTEGAEARPAPFVPTYTTYDAGAPIPSGITMTEDAPPPPPE